MGLNLSVEAGMSVDEGSVRTGTDASFDPNGSPLGLAHALNLSTQCVAVTEETCKLPCVYLKQRRHGMTRRAWEADRGRRERWGDRDR